MTDRKTYTAEDFKGCNGRRVRVEAVIDDGDPEKGPNLILLFDHDRRMTVAKSAIVEILPEEIGEGDCVAFGISRLAKVLAIRNGRAWIEYEDGIRDDWPVSHLTLVERTA